MNPKMVVWIEIIGLQRPEVKPELIRLVEGGFEQAHDELETRRVELERLVQRLTRVKGTRSPYKKTFQNPKRPNFITRKRLLLKKLEDAKFEVQEYYKLLAAACLILETN
jgi:hypothetical protein